MEDWITQHNNSLTLREMLEAGNELIFECSQCGRQTRLDMKELAIKHGLETRIAFVKRNTNCPNCG